MKLKDYLIYSGQTADMFANIVGVDRNTVYNIMQGRFEPRLSTAIMIVEKSEGNVTFQDLQIPQKSADKLSVKKKKRRIVTFSDLGIKVPKGAETSIPFVLNKVWKTSNEEAEEEDAKKENSSN